MRQLWFTSAFLLAVAFSPRAIASTSETQAEEPGDRMAAKKQPSKSPAKPSAKQPAKKPTPSPKTQSNQPYQGPEPAVRRATAGPGVAAPPESESTELQALRRAEQDLFGPQPQEESAEGCPPGLLPGAGGVEVFASGLPPPPSAPRPELATPKLDFVSSLRMPDIPMKWTPRILQYLDFYKNDPRGRTIITIWYRKSGGYEPMLRSVLRRHGVPEDLMWVAVVESGLRPTVYSPVGAAGLWQFMPESGRLYGLVVDRWVDQRLDPVRATHAAAMYLQDLHKRFGAWELALASYNMGFGGMLASIRKYNTNDFWELSRYEAGIPWETMLYVPKILALAVVAKNPDVFGLTNVQRDPPIEFDEVDVAPGVSLEAIAKAAAVDVSDIEQLNPQLLASRVPPWGPNRTAMGLWTIRVPKGHAAKVDAELVKTRAAEPNLVPYTVRHGESTADIAKSFGITTGELTRHNALRSDEVPRPGTVLMVPPKRAGAKAGEEKPVVVVPVDLQPPSGHNRRFYQPVAGDTLEGVAAALAVSADDLRRWNGLDPRARLQPGMSLMAIMPTSQEFQDVRLLMDDEVRVLVVGSDAFFDHFEGLRGRVRMVTVVRAGETWQTISKRTGLSLGMLERINHRSRSTPLQPGERLVVYVPEARVAAQPKPTVTEEEGAGRAPIEPPAPDSLPPDPEKVMEPEKAEAESA